jgi:hypothetical protein
MYENQVIIDRVGAIVGYAKPCCAVEPESNVLCCRLLFSNLSPAGKELIIDETWFRRQGIRQMSLV